MKNRNVELAPGGKTFAEMKIPEMHLPGIYAVAITNNGNDATQ